MKPSKKLITCTFKATTNLAADKAVVKYHVANVFLLGREVGTGGTPAETKGNISETTFLHVASVPILPPISYGSL